LLARPKMPDSHTWRITDALISSGKFTSVIHNTEIPIHNGSNIRLLKLPMPNEPKTKEDNSKEEPIL